VTLPDLIKLALERNPGLAAARRGVEVAEQGRNIAFGQQFGLAEVFGNYQYAGFDAENKRRIGSLVMGMPQLSPRLNPEDQFAHSTFAAGVRYTVPIYAGGAIVANIRLSDLAALAAQNRVEQTQDQLIFNVSSTYYMILRIGEDLKAVQASIQALEEAQRNTAAQVRVGRVPEVNLFKINTRLAAVRQQLIRVQNALELANVGLNTLLGLEDVTQRLPLGEALRYTPEVIDLQRSLQAASERRPELKALEREAGIQEERVRIAFAERLPNVSLGLTYQGFAGDSQLGTLIGDGTVNVGVSVPIFTGGVLVSLVAQERARLARLQEDLRDLRLRVGQEVDSAVLNITEAQARVRVAEAALTEARESLRIEQMKLQVGKGIIEEFLITQADELEAETNLFRAQADANVAWVDLQRAVGLIEVQASAE